MPMALARRATARPVWPRPRISSVAPSIGSTFPRNPPACLLLPEEAAQAERKAQHRAQHIFGHHVGPGTGRVGHRHGGGIPWPEMVDAGAADRQPFHQGFRRALFGEIPVWRRSARSKRFRPGLLDRGGEAGVVVAGRDRQVRMRVGQDGKRPERGCRCAGRSRGGGACPVLRRKRIGRQPRRQKRLECPSLMRRCGPGHRSMPGGPANGSEPAQILGHPHMTAMKSRPAVVSLPGGVRT